MDENTDFVIDTRMPVTPPDTESIPVEQQAEESAPVIEDVPIEEETSADPEVSEIQVPEVSETQESDSNESSELEGPESAQEEVGPSLADIAALIEGLQRKFDEKIAVDEHKNGLFDKLYQERDEYKNDFYGKLLKPFITGCIEIINDLRMYAAKMDTYDVERSLNYLRTLPDDILELLENNGVELYSEESDTFNPRRQRAKKIVPTEDAALNNRIAERLDKGYSWNGVVLRPEMVAVYKLS